MRCAVVVVALAACYHPSYEDCQVSCTTFGCPDGLTCEGGMCRTANAVGECAILPPDDGGLDGDTGDGSGSRRRRAADRGRRRTHLCGVRRRLGVVLGRRRARTDGRQRPRPVQPQPDV